MHRMSLPLALLVVMMATPMISGADEETPAEAAANAQVRKPLVIVGSDILTSSDLDAYIAPDIDEAQRNLSGTALMEARLRITKDGLKRLIEERLFILEGRRLAAENLEFREWVDQRAREFERDITHQHGNEIEYQEWIRRRGLTYKQEKDRQRDYILGTFVLERFVGKDAYVSPAEIGAYYDEHRDDFTVPRRVAYRQISLPSADYGSAEKAQQQADWIRKNMAPDGHDFELWAKKYSKGPRAEKGGRWDLGEWGTEDPQLRDLILKLEVNQISPVTPGTGGFYIFMVEKESPGYTKTLFEAQAEITRRMSKEKRLRARQDMAMQLRERFYVKMLSEP
jgi:peptidyl-prolyl cis-trans isomerase SurA